MTKKTQFIVVGTAVVIVLAVLTIQHVAADNGRIQTTDDAYVSADFSTVAPRVAGLIDHVFVDDNALVHAGQELAHIDDRDYRIALTSTEAGLASAKADVENLDSEIARQQALIDQARATLMADDAALAFSKANAARYRNLSRAGAGTVEQQQQSTSDLQRNLADKERDEAALAATKAQVPVLEAQRTRAVAQALRAAAARDQAKLNLSYTRIVAPVGGMVGERGVRVGSYVSPETPLLAVVPLQAAYILANFLEDQLDRISNGQCARITVDSFPGQALHGWVDSLAPASGIAFSPIPPDNATGNFTKVVQRLALKIRLEPDQPLLQRLRVGMSVEARINTATARCDVQQGISK
ncbi:HlyD family secretion protein [Acidisoma silvae]|uniref:HlyD family secretion protein n=1 Tax=Acidisoma silvae TaxID=2802396 RepID=A0A963YVH1_9PROT|nr:HlyD family secretion protein [Acidisoma silvae]MCB8877858.1 HlyD family secretion protein [Acidisoma silvae]